jgi:murein L,D-transpeptidase YcbB/YkuD
MLTQSNLVSRLTTVTFTVILSWFAATALAQSPAEDALKQIIADGNPGYLNWSAALADRDSISKIYEENGYRLLWSDGVKPTQQALALLQELRAAGERGLEPEDYPGNQLAYLLVDLIDSKHAEVEQWAVFDASLSLAGIRFLSGTTSPSKECGWTYQKHSRIWRRRSTSRSRSMRSSRSSVTMRC